MSKTALILIVTGVYLAGLTYIDHALGDNKQLVVESLIAVGLISLGILAL
jgi:hypothetical protein